MNPSIIELKKIPDPRGNLSVVEGGIDIPFHVKRVYWIYDVPGGEIRGSHAFKNTEEIIVALSGSFDAILNDGVNEYKFPLNRSYYGLLVPKMYWRRLENFSTNSTALILASTVYDAEDYIRDFGKFKNLREHG